MKNKKMTDKQIAKYVLMDTGEADKRIREGIIKIKELWRDCKQDERDKKAFEELRESWPSIFTKDGEIRIPKHWDKMESVE